MKTTIELPDELLQEAKIVAARRRTSLKAIMEHALRRELHGDRTSGNTSFTLDEHGLPVLNRREDDAVQVTSEQVYQLMDDLGI